MTGRRFGLTRRGWTVAGAAVGLLAGGRLLGADELSVLGLAALAVLAGATIWAATTRPALRVRRRIEPVRLHVDDDARVDLTVVATRATPLVDVTDLIDHGRLRARFLLAPLRTGAATEPAYRLPTDYRGPLVLGPAMAVRTDPLGLAHRRRVVAPEETVLVRPRIHAIAAPALGAGQRHASQDAESPRAPADDAGGEFLAVRPYEVGDDPRRVHWPSSARADDLMVRQFVAPRRGHTLVVLDTRSAGPDAPETDAAFERAVEATASIIAALTRAGRPSECVTTGGTVLGAVGTDPKRTIDRLATVMRNEPDLIDALARSRRTRPPELVVLVTATGDARVSAARAALARRTASVVVVTGGEAAAAGRAGAHAGPVIDARTVPLVDAWRAAHPAHRVARTRAARPGPLTVVR